MRQAGLKEFTFYLKVPKREIFDRSDFPDFYTMKSLRVGDFGVKIKKILQIFRGSFRGAKFLMRMLRIRIKAGAYVSGSQIFKIIFKYLKN